jgi:hypothetical protein
MEYAVYKDGRVPGLSGSVTVATGETTVWLTYDYGLGTIPDTAAAVPIDAPAWPVILVAPLAAFAVVRLVVAVRRRR